MSEEKDRKGTLNADAGKPRKKSPDESMRIFSEVMKQLSMLTQFGLSLMTPTVLCLVVCYFLTVKAGAGIWVYIPGLILGLGSSAMVAWKFYCQVLKDGKKQDEKKEKTFSYNRHE